MLFFVISLAAGIAAVLGVQKLDIEAMNAPAPKRPAPKASAAANTGARAPAAGGFVPSTACLGQQ